MEQQPDLLEQASIRLAAATTKGSLEAEPEPAGEGEKRER